MKRKNYINWDEYFMGIALFSSERSKDNNTIVGACIVNSEHKIVSVGYNGMPKGCNDDEMPWQSDGKSNFYTKYPFVCHAELNAILNSSITSLNGCILYVTLFPCHECAKAIIQCNIKKIVYYNNKYTDTESIAAANFMFQKSGVETIQYYPKGKTITINI